MLQSRHQGCEFGDQDAFILPGKVRGISGNLPLVITIPNDHALRIGDQTDNRWLRKRCNSSTSWLPARRNLYVPRLIRINQPGNQLHVQLQGKGTKQGAPGAAMDNGSCPDRLRDAVQNGETRRASAM